MKNQNLRRSKAKKWRAKLDVACLINQGYSRDDIVARLQEDYDYSESYSYTLYYDALKTANQQISDYISEASKTNVQRIISIIDQCYADKRYNDALRAIDMLNKMGGLYAPEEHTITTNEPINITFE